MRSSRKGPRPSLVFIGLGAAYPFLIYFGLRHVSPGLLAAGLIGLLAARLVFAVVTRRKTAPAFWIAGAGALLLVIASPAAGLKAYPILVSLSFAAVFSYSLLFPPTMIERIARLREPDLPSSAVPYLRKVTLAWLGFFLINAAISAATALSGSLALWTLYNGFISYLAMGALFVGEMIVRRLRRTAADTA